MVLQINSGNATSKIRVRNETSFYDKLHKLTPLYTSAGMYNLALISLSTVPASVLN